MMEELEVIVSPDKMSAYIRLENSASSDAIIEEEYVIAKITEYGIVYGISQEDIADFCKTKSSLSRHKIAYGLRPVDGEDGKYVLLFETETGSPKQLEDGKVDFRDLNLIHNVQKDDILCTIVPPVVGEDGYNVYGSLVKAKEGRQVNIKAGKNVVLSEDGTEMRAETDGCVKFENGAISIEEVYRIKGDVGMKTGHVVFNGSVTIDGSVAEGFNVTAQKDIQIGGRVEGCEIKAGGNIVIANGISGMNKANIHAKGDISTKFIESAEVACEGNIYCDIILKSTVKAGKSIIMRGKRGAIIGGSALAGEKIVAKTLGSDLNLHQTVTIEKDWRLREQGAINEQQAEKESRSALKIKLATAEQYFALYAKKIKEENSLGEEKNMKTLREYMVKKSETAAIISSLKTLLSQVQEEEAFSSIVCTGTIFPGVKIVIDHCMMNVLEPMQYQKFYVADGEIALGAILPGEGNG